MNLKCMAKPNLKLRWPNMKCQSKGARAESLVKLGPDKSRIKALDFLTSLQTISGIKIIRHPKHQDRDFLL